LHNTLSIIGCGKVGKALGRLWTAKRTYLIQDVVNRSMESSRHAVSFIGSGRPVGNYAELRPAAIYMIAAGDDQVVSCCEQLARTGKLSADSVVFHCSGALRSAELQAARQHGAAVASIHPIRSFAEPEQAAADFAGTYCGIEGDRRALDVLTQGFEAIGAKMVEIDADFKIIYHSAAVFASNYLVTLLDVAIEAYVKSGIPRDTALELMNPLVQATVDNVLRLGTKNALTGPIARGDTDTAQKQQRAVADWNAQYGELYRQLARLTAGLAGQSQEPFL
jgi:predicted short-subunit dehydrogenase-like oxidoreductase (DUF2520 family)